MYPSRAETNLVMKAQTEQMKATNDNIADIEAGLQSANKCMFSLLLTIRDRPSSRLNWQ